MDDRLREFEPMLQAIASKYFGPGLDRDDLVQEARIGAWGGLCDFRPDQGASLRTFVSFCAERMVQTAVLAARRRKHEHLNHAAHLDAPVTDGGLTLSDLVSDAGQDPFEQISLRDELRAIVHQLNDLELLTDLERTAFVGIEFEGRTYDEIREPLRASRKQVDNAVQRARRKLREPAPAPDTRRRLAPSPPVRRPPCPPHRKEPRRMSALEAVRSEISESQEEREALDQRLEKLREAEALLASLDDQATAPPVEQPKRRRTRPAPSRAVKVNDRQVTDPVPDTTTPADPPAEAPTDAPTGLSNAEIGKRNAEQVVELVKQHPGGLDVHEVAEKLGRSAQSVGNSLNKATREGKLDVKRLGQGPKAKRVWFPLNQGVAVADENGARTDLERRVLDTLNGSGLTTEEVQHNVDGINFRVAGEICAALARRGVIDRREAPSGRILWSRAG